MEKEAAKEKMVMHEEDGKEGALQGSNELRQSSVQSND